VFFEVLRKQYISNSYLRMLRIHNKQNTNTRYTRVVVVLFIT